MKYVEVSYEHILDVNISLKFELEQKLKAYISFSRCNITFELI